MSQTLAMRSTKAATETYRDALALAYCDVVGEVYPHVSSRRV